MESETDLREQLAAIEHERWADWQKYVHSLMGTMGNQYVIDGKYILWWNKQIATPYVELTEPEKDSDREQVDRYWPLIVALVERREREFAKELIGEDEHHLLAETTDERIKAALANRNELRREMREKAGL